MSEVVGVASRSHSDMFMIVLRGYISRSRDRNLDGFGSGHGPPINVSGSGWIHLGYCIVISDRYAGVRGEKDRPVMHCGPHERVGCLPSLFLLVHSVGFKTLHPLQGFSAQAVHTWRSPSSPRRRVGAIARYRRACATHACCNFLKNLSPKGNGDPKGTTTRCTQGRLPQLRIRPRRVPKNNSIGLGRPTLL